MHDETRTPGPGVRPKLPQPLTTLDWLMEIGALAGITVTALILAVAWPSLPRTVPMHFGPSGRVDAWGDRSITLALPILVAFIYGVTTLLGRFPHVFNYPWPITPENAAAQYRAAGVLLRGLKLEMAWLFAYIQWRMIRIALGDTNGLGAWFLPAALALVLATLGWGIVRMYRAR